PTVLPLAAGVRSFSNIPHTYLDNPAGRSTDSVAVTITTSDHQSATATIPVIVRNVAPTLSGITRSASTINENDDLTVSGIVTDPAGMLDAPNVVITWGDGPATTTVPATTAPGLLPGQLAFSATHRYLDDPGGASSGSFPISIVVTDKDGGTENAGTVVTVANIPPTARLRGSYDESSGLLTMQSFVMDLGTRDTFTYDWQATGGGVPIPSGHADTYSFAPTSNTGYIVTLTVTDNSGGAGTTSAIVFIGTPDPDLITIAPAGAGQVTITSN